ncbi:MAG: L,D-transpeptidase [Chloroflexota bacterium]|nr:L,D-transpeptidase [Chloroflexota bacterium]
MAGRLIDGRQAREHRGGIMARGIRLLGMALILVLLTTPLVGSIASAQEDWAPPPTVYIEKTGHTLDRLFLEAWRADPGLLGNPITEELEQVTGLGEDPGKVHTVQYFERMAIAYLPENEPGDQVETLPLGRDAAQRADRRYRPAIEARGTCDGLEEDVCVTFDETDHTLRLGFKEYWELAGGEDMLGLPLSEEFTARDGRTVQFFEKAALQWQPGEDVMPRSLGKDAAKRLKLDTKRIPQPADVPEYDEALFVPPPPEPDPPAEDEETVVVVGGDGFGPGRFQGGDKEIVISISAQAMWAYEGDQLVNSSLVSTGVGEVPETVTPLGFHQILSKYDVQTMEGTISNEYYRVPDVPDVMYFDNLGNALHGAYWHNNFGVPMSHGCVNLPLHVAAWMYDWAPIGTAVTVIE